MQEVMALGGPKTYAWSSFLILDRVANLGRARVSKRFTLVVEDFAASEQSGQGRGTFPEKRTPAWIAVDPAVKPLDVAETDRS
jgi:hypothetical protein